jgi:TrpR-related protein YerC/YecD
VSTPNTDDLNALFEAFALLETPAEAAAFLADIGTRAEINGFAARWRIAQLLDEGVVYRDIAEQVGTSTTTVTRVNSALNHGDGGYRTVLERINPA